MGVQDKELVAKILEFSSLRMWVWHAKQHISSTLGMHSAEDLGKYRGVTILHK